MRRQDERRLLALLLAPDVEEERRRANERFACRPPQSLEEELAWQREVQLRAEADQVRQEIEDQKIARRLDDELFKAAFERAMQVLGKKRLELLLGKRLHHRKRKLSLEEARLLRSLLSEVDSEGETALYCGGDAK